MKNRFALFAVVVVLIFATIVYLKAEKPKPVENKPASSSTTKSAISKPVTTPEVAKTTQTDSSSSEKTTGKKEPVEPITVCLQSSGVRLSIVIPTKLTVESIPKDGDKPEAVTFTGSNCETVLAITRTPWKDRKELKRTLKRTSFEDFGAFPPSSQLKKLHPVMRNGWQEVETSLGTATLVKSSTVIDSGDTKTGVQRLIQYNSYIDGSGGLLWIFSQEEGLLLQVLGSIKEVRS